MITKVNINHVNLPNIKYLNKLSQVLYKKARFTPTYKFVQKTLKGNLNLINPQNIKYSHKIGEVEGQYAESLKTQTDTPTTPDINNVEFVQAGTINMGFNYTFNTPDSLYTYASYNSSSKKGLYQINNTTGDAVLIYDDLYNFDKCYSSYDGRLILYSSYSTKVIILIKGQEYNRITLDNTISSNTVIYENSSNEIYIGSYYQPLTYVHGIDSVEVLSEFTVGKILDVNETTYVISGSYSAINVSGLYTIKGKQVTKIIGDIKLNNSRYCVDDFGGLYVTGYGSDNKGLYYVYNEKAEIIYDKANVWGYTRYKNGYIVVSNSDGSGVYYIEKNKCTTICTQGVLNSSGSTYTLTISKGIKCDYLSIYKAGIIAIDDNLNGTIISEWTGNIHYYVRTENAEYIWYNTSTPFLYITKDSIVDISETVTVRPASSSSSVYYKDKLYFRCYDSSDYEYLYCLEGSTSSQIWSMGKNNCFRKLMLGPNNKIYAYDGYRYGGTSGWNYGVREIDPETNSYKTVPVLTSNGFDAYHVNPITNAIFFYSTTYRGSSYEYSTGFIVIDNGEYKAFKNLYRVQNCITDAWGYTYIISDNPKHILLYHNGQVTYVLKDDCAYLYTFEHRLGIICTTNKVFNKDTKVILLQKGIAYMLDMNGITSLDK